MTEWLNWTEVEEIKKGFSEKVKLDLQPERSQIFQIWKTVGLIKSWKWTHKAKSIRYWASWHLQRSCGRKKHMSLRNWKVRVTKAQCMKENCSDQAGEKGKARTLRILWVVLRILGFIQSVMNGKAIRSIKAACGEKGTLLHSWREWKLGKPLCKTVSWFLKKLKIKLSYNPAIPLLGILLEKMKTNS